MNSTSSIQKAGTLLTRTTAQGVQIYLIHRPQYDDWSLPKGHIEAGETTEQAALRETLEETGLYCTIVRRLPQYHYTSPQGQTCVVEMFECAVEQNEHQTVTSDGEHIVPCDNGETDHGEWLNVNAAIRRITYPSLQEYLRTIFPTS